MVKTLPSKVNTFWRIVSCLQNEIHLLSWFPKAGFWAIWLGYILARPRCDPQVTHSSSDRKHRLQKSAFTSWDSTEVLLPLLCCLSLPVFLSISLQNVFFQQTSAISNSSLSTILSFFICFNHNVSSSFPHRLHYLSIPIKHIPFFWSGTGLYRSSMFPKPWGVISLHRQNRPDGCRSKEKYLPMRLHALMMWSISYL